MEIKKGDLVDLQMKGRSKRFTKKVVRVSCETFEVSSGHLFRKKDGFGVQTGEYPSLWRCLVHRGENK